MTDAAPNAEVPSPQKAALWRWLWPGSRYVVIESAKTPEQLTADLRAALGPSWNIFTPGLKGWVLGPCVRVGWVPKWSHYCQRSHLAFRGWLVKAPDGSGGCSLRGYIRMHWLLLLFLFMWYFVGVGTLLMWLDTNSPRYGHDSLSWAVMTVPGLCALSLGTKAAVREIHARLTVLCQVGE